MSDGRWHVAVDGTQHGPLTVDEIRARGPLPADALVWTEGMAEWLPASATPLAGLVGGAAPPPIGGMAAMPSIPHAMTAGGGGPAVGVGFLDAVKIAFAKYVDFTGRASRSEFWWFMVFVFAASVLTAWNDYLGALVGLALFLPNIAVGVRRLHDTDRSGWWYLIGFVPVIGIIVLIVFFAQRGTQGHNRFG